MSSDAAAKPRILVVDDDPASLDLMETFLRAEGFAVETAFDGNQALSMTGGSEYALVVLDVHMPIYSGVELLQLIRKQHLAHPVPVIALTGDDSAQTSAALQKSGVNAVLSKPVDFQQLRAEVNRLIPRR